MITDLIIIGLGTALIFAFGIIHTQLTEKK